MDDCCDPTSAARPKLTIEGLPWPLKPLDDPCESQDCCCGDMLLNVEIGYYEPGPAEAVRSDLSCDCSPLKIDDRPQQLDWDRVDGLTAGLSGSPGGLPLG